jgi:hypothetical protein
MTRDELLSRLTEEGVTNPASWLVKFKHAHIEAALDRLDDAYEREESAAGAVRHYGDAVMCATRSPTRPASSTVCFAQRQNFRRGLLATDAEGRRDGAYG